MQTHPLTSLILFSSPSLSLCFLSKLCHLCQHTGAINLQYLTTLRHLCPLMCSP